MNTEHFAKPVLVYDGECGFCRAWVGYARTVAQGAVSYAPYQEVADRFAQVPREEFAQAVQLMFPDGTRYAAAHAVFRLLAESPKRRHRMWLWLYKRMPGFSPVSEWVYRLVARNRSFFARLFGPFLRKYTLDEAKQHKEKRNQ